jgi:hypothetical protein
LWICDCDRAVKIQRLSDTYEGRETENFELQEQATGYERGLVESIDEKKKKYLGGYP